MKGKSKGDVFFFNYIYIFLYIRICMFWLGYVYMGVNIVGIGVRYGTRLQVHVKLKSLNLFL